MKATLVSILAGAALFLSAPDAFAQDDDDDIFGDGDGTPGDGTPKGDDDDDGGGGDATGGGDEGGGGGPPMAAKAMIASGTIGVGFSLSALGVSGIEAEYWLSDSLMAGGLARLQIVSVDGNDTFLGITVGGGAFLVLKGHDKAALMFGGRFLLGFASEGTSTTSIAIEGPLRLHMQLHKNVSAHVEGGLVLAISDQAALNGSAANNFGFGFGSTNVFGQAGITFYLD